MRIREWGIWSVLSSRAGYRNRGHVVGRQIAVGQCVHTSRPSSSRLVTVMSVVAEKADTGMETTRRCMRAKIIDIIFLVEGGDRQAAQVGAGPEGRADTLSTDGSTQRLVKLALGLCPRLALFSQPRQLRLKFRTVPRRPYVTHLMEQHFPFLLGRKALPEPNRATVGVTQTRVVGHQVWMRGSDGDAPFPFYPFGSPLGLPKYVSSHVVRG